MANETHKSQAGIEGQCPRCMAPLMLRAHGWPSEHMAQAGEVYSCIMCGHWEDSVVRANRLMQHQSVTEAAVLPR